MRQFALLFYLYCGEQTISETLSPALQWNDAASQRRFAAVFPTERWPSGWRRTLGKCLCTQSPSVTTSPNLASLQLVVGSLVFVVARGHRW